MATEKRLIDANALINKGIKAFVKREGLNLGCYQWTDEVYVVRVSDICTAPTVDAVEVVRCKDCKHWLPYPSLGVNDCGLHKGLVLTNENTYCSYGERKTDG